MKNLYKSIQDLPIKFFESEEMKATLVDSKLAPGLAQKTSQLLHLEEASNIRSYRTYRSKLNYLELGSNSNRQEVESGKGFVKGPSKFLVKNNLSLKPFSAIDGKMIETEMNVRPEDTGTLKVTVDKDKALHLLAASLVSKSALTDVYILNEPTNEQNQGCNVGGNHEEDDCCCCCPF
ncbi:hypothetical protein F0562_020257 [Nyssa sinensis]|uniref:Uncharacterized protein n=1 Tax=Nyssa sinensis TaxID=561372 RepID=A0A5J5BQM7_9ASTE|nr:hypothetical protein F0562_020257 [Nyssa sinensis]